MIALLEAAHKAQVVIKNASADVLECGSSKSSLSKARNCLESAAESINNLIIVQTGLNDVAKALDIDTPSSLSILPTVNRSIEEACKAAEEAKSRGKAAADALQAVSVAPQVTGEILQVIVKTIENEPNIKPVELFLKRTREASS